MPDKYVATTPITFPFTSSERPVPRSGLSTAATFRNHLIEIGSRRQGAGSPLVVDMVQRIGLLAFLCGVISGGGRGGA